jgi:hypothetical protein
MTTSFLKETIRGTIKSKRRVRKRNSSWNFARLNIFATNKKRSVFFACPIFFETYDTAASGGQTDSSELVQIVSAGMRGREDHGWRGVSKMDSLSAANVGFLNT